MPSLLVVICSLLTALLPAQEPAPIYDHTAVDRPAVLPEGSVKIDAGRPDNPDTRFLTAIYQTVTYPRRAREAGIQETVRVEFVVNTLGEVAVDTSFIVRREDMDKYAAPAEEDMVIVTGYSTSRVNGGPATRQPPRRPTRSSRRRERAEADLIERTAETVAGLPRHTPAVHDGETVATRRTIYVVFQME